MATLHLVNASPSASSALRDCLYAATTGDTVMLIENGVYGAVNATFERHGSRGSVLHWCALIDDARARGIMERMAGAVRLVDAEAFVDLVESHQPIVSWS
jgi:tRNA 2-thiouridine synthesizing protein B